MISKREEGQLGNRGVYAIFVSGLPTLLHIFSANKQLFEREYVRCKRKSRLQIPTLACDFCAAYFIFILVGLIYFVLLLPSLSVRCEFDFLSTSYAFYITADKICKLKCWKIFRNSM